ncbi:MAG: hypothetical protein ACQXXL_04730 [Candidatus Methanosuratincola sp.]
MSAYGSDRDPVDTVVKRLMGAGIEPIHPPELIEDWGDDYYTVSYCDPDNFVIPIFHTKN